MGASWQPAASPRSSKAMIPGLTLSHQHLPGMGVVALAGELDRTTSAELDGCLQRVRLPGDHLVMDLAELSFMDSSGLHVVLACARACAADGANLHLAAARGGPARVLTITGVEERLPCHATVQEAISAVLAARRDRAG